MVSRGVLFLDLDGTIANSGLGITTALNQVFADAGIAPLTPDEGRWILGPAFQTTMPTLLERRNVSGERSEEFIQLYRQLYKREYLPHTPIIDGMAEVLDELSKNWHLAVVTAKPLTQAEVAVRAIDVHHHMVTVVGPDEGTPTPKSQLLQRAMTEVHHALNTTFSVDQCWMIGDRHHDIDAAVEVGTHSAGVLWGYGDHQELSSAGATAVVEQPSDLLILLG